MLVLLLILALLDWTSTPLVLPDWMKMQAVLLDWVEAQSWVLCPLRCLGPDLDMELDNLDLVNFV